MDPLNGSLIDPHNGSLTYFDAKPSKELLLSSWILMVTIFGECRRLFSRMSFSRMSFSRMSFSRMSEEFRLSFRRTIASRNEDHLQKGWMVGG